MIPSAPSCFVRTSEPDPGWEPLLNPQSSVRHVPQESWPVATGSWLRNRPFEVNQFRPSDEGNAPKKRDRTHEPTNDPGRSLPKVARLSAAHLLATLSRPGTQHCEPDSHPVGPEWEDRRPIAADKPLPSLPVGFEKTLQSL